MANVKVEVDGTQASDVFDVEFESASGADIGGATVTVANTQSNRNLFASGAEVAIFREDTSNPGTFDKEWVGEVIGKPSNASRDNLSLSIEAESKVAQAEYGKINRPFIEMDTGAIVREAVNKQVEPYTRPVFIHRGSSTTNWSSDAPIFELADVDSKGLNQFGSDVLFAGFREDQAGTFHVTFDDVPASAAPDGRILKFETRLLAHNDGNVFSGEVELRDAGGNNYVWDLDLPGYGGFKTFEFAVEDADFDAGELGSNLSLEYRFTVDGGLPEDRAIAIDMARTTPFSLQSRQTALSTAEVETTGRTISRRFDASILEVANALAIEDGATVFVDENDVLHYESKGDTHVPPSLNIVDDGSVPVVNVEVDRDYDVRNRVTVQGKGDLQRTFEDTSSIDFYNTEAPKEEPIIDKSLRTDEQLEARARGFLTEHAWEDTAVEFTIASGKWKDVDVGQAIDVSWSNEDVNGTFIVSSVGTTSAGYVTIGMAGSTQV